MLNRQPKTLEKAIIEYKRRDSREPPPGFEKWYKAAVDAKVPNIDAYDTVMAVCEPFCGISAKESRARVQEAIFPRVEKTPIIGVHLEGHEILRLLAETPERQEITKEIAEAGVEWADKP